MVCETSELLKDEERSVEEEPLCFSELENIIFRDEDQVKNGEMGRGLKVEQQDGDGQEERAELSPLTANQWDGPRELKMTAESGERRIQSCQALLLGTTWGPFPGKIEMTTGGSDKVSLLLSGGPRWLMDMMWVSAEDGKSNCAVYSKDGQVWCSTTKNIFEGEELAACVVDLQSHLQTASQTLYSQGMFSAQQLDSIQLLPRRAAMASILPSINKDIFPCKACGMWFWSERNLQAHLMHYCSGRQRDPVITAEKNTNISHQLLHSCTYPQCNMSFTGLHAFEIHLSTHNSLKSEETTTGSQLKCTICDYTAETLIVLQHHILSHLSQTGLRCSHCHFTFQTPKGMAKHQELHGHSSTGNKQIKDKLDNSHSIAGSSQQVRANLSMKDLQESTVQCEIGQISEVESTESGQTSTKGEGNSGTKASVSFSRVKSEPSSPRLASSPIQHHLPPAFPIAPLMPHIPFSQDITVGPQASEILAKMSELVHRRLRQGRNSYPPVMYSTLVPKGATCFECNITFNNLDNYLVHKKHYCSSRWEHTPKPHDFPGLLDKPAGTVSPKVGGSLAVMLNAGHPSEVKCHESTTCNPIAAGKVSDELSVQVKKASTPSGAQERPNGTQLDLQSPKMPPTETDIGPSQTTCEACKITFSHHENFMVHKQYYCATRHDPHLKRANNNKGQANQKSVRPRKRRKAYELTSDQEQMPHMGMPSFLGFHTIGGPYMSKDAMESFREHQRYNMIQGLVPKYPEASLTVSKSALSSKCNTISKEEGNAPIDLSKKCMPQLGKTPLSPKGLMDYHECAVCKICFNKVEDYLMHKQNFCPGTVLQDKSSENKVCLSIKKESPINSGNLLENAIFESPAQHAKIEHLNAVSTSDIRVSSEDHLIPVKEELRIAFQSSGFYPSSAKNIRPDEQIWPYYEIKPTDYATGMLVKQSECRQSPNEGSEGEKDQPMPDGSHLSTEDHENQDKTLPLNDSLDLEDKVDDAGNKHHSSCTPDVHTDSTVNCKVSTTLLQSVKTEEVSTSFKRVLNGSIATTGNVKYCRPCDIQFNNLSNFITHKKFYCSSHTTEHVK
ncbi:zinc finger protein ZFPM2-like [Xyrauchen texanus]|uniref:zinc finger protein ZFPM2-like n=1 Tax=Xyrauchen texanus TaxID=154827 RepID=UPI002241A5CD|nr:zinc finger protein ZFPM2-like [Xyrauchen texanus]